MNLKNIIVKGALITSLLSSPLYSGCIRPYDTEVQEGETTEYRGSKYLYT